MAADLLELVDVEAGYGRAALVLRGLTVRVPPASVVCLVGPNGAGKSTVLKVASGLLAPRSGRILLDGEDVTGHGPRALLAAGLSHVLQGHSVFREMTVGENVLLGAYTVRDKAEVAERVDFVRALFPVVGERWDALAGALSGGQQKQVEFARSLMVRPRVVLLDEPSMGLDPKAMATVFEQIVRMRDAGTAILLVEQNARRALEIADQGCVLDLGRVHINGPAADLLRNPTLGDLYLGRAPGSEAIGKRALGNGVPGEHAVEPEAPGERAAKPDAPGIHDTEATALAEPDAEPDAFGERAAKTSAPGQPNAFGRRAAELDVPAEPAVEPDAFGENAAGPDALGVRAAETDVLRKGPRPGEP